MHMGYVKECFGTLVEFDIYTCALNKLSVCHLPRCLSYNHLTVHSETLPGHSDHGNVDRKL